MASVREGRSASAISQNETSHGYQSRQANASPERSHAAGRRQGAKKKIKKTKKA
jgi:hypothetical protein